MKEQNISLTKSEVRHLLGLLDENQAEGSYYGNKKQYYKRTEVLIEKLAELDTIKLSDLNIK